MSVFPSPWLGIAHICFFPALNNESRPHVLRLSPCGERNMNRLCSFLFICCAGNLFAQTNSPSVSPQLFSMPQVGLRLSDPEPLRTPVMTANRRLLHLGLEQSQDVSVDPEPSTTPGPETPF